MTLQTEQEIVSLQRNMLETVCQYVKVGGTLLYSTCTMDKMENEDNVTWFLKQHPQFELVKMQQIFPQKTYGDGFFLAKLQKKRERLPELLMNEGELWIKRKRQISDR